ncbi:MAG: SusC/RagA family TonB-linked outer membrane protein [Flammeovirgaceae bacterium]
MIELVRNSWIRKGLKYAAFTFLIALFAVGSPTNTRAQTAATVLSGTVVEKGTQETIIGATIRIANEDGGTTTDINGKFTLKTPITSGTLIISFIGYETREISFNGSKSDFSIVLAPSATQLEELVVTALGIKREEKALGYASQSVDSKQLTTVRSQDPFTALKGKVAGLQVNSSSNGLASSSRIVVRGEKSLNINDNSPLIVIDGTPVNNDTYGVGGSSTNQSDMPTDYGNAALDINAEDIESINVLKGAAASALYGSRGGNGVILITTKSGKQQEGLGIRFTSATSLSRPLVLPEIQTTYGGGWGGNYFADFGTNFGPAFDPTLIIPQDGSPNFGNGEQLPFVQRFDFNDFFQTGIATNNQLSLSGSTGQFNYRLSYANSYNEGIVPNTNLIRDNINLSTSYQLTDKLRVNLNGTYINSRSDNLPVAGYGNQGIMYTLLWNYNNVDLNWLKDYWVEKDVQQNQLFSWGDNPFFITNENLNGFNKDRIFGNVSANYQITPELSAMVRMGIDNFDDLRTSRRPYSSVRYPTGMYREQNIAFIEKNVDFLLTYNKTFSKFSTVISLGGNRMDQRIQEGLVEGRGLAIPGIYTLGNINVTPTLDRFDAEKRVNSLYAFANIGYQGFLYLDLTARNDWSSTLPPQNNSYFYPSASLSFVLSEVMDMGAQVDFLKLRANIAQVGNDTDPYQLQRTYAFGALPNSVTNISELPNSNLKPVTTTSTEFGIQAKFFNKRLFLDLGIFRSLSRDQIISADISQASGFNSIVVNAGEIETTGLELALNGTPIQKAGFEWNLGMNFTTNTSVVNALYGDLETFIVAQGPGDATVEARVGGQLGDIYGNVFARSPEGEIIYGSNGLPELDTERRKIGNYNPDWLMGLTSTISYKGLSFYALFNIRHGGYIYSYTNAIGAESGLLAHSVAGHEDGIIGDGVMLDGNGNYVPNTHVASAEAWYYGGYYARNNVEANGFDASFIKLKEVSISYDLPKSLVSKLGLQSMSIALTGNNVALWTDVPHIDPEAQALNGGTLVPGFEVTQLPSTRSFGYRLTIGF